MRCDDCGAEVPADATFCHACGKRLEDSSGTDIGGTPESPVKAASRPIEQLQEAGRKLQYEEEEELWRGGYSPKAMLGAWIGAGILTIVAIVLAALFLADVVGWAVVVGAVVVMWLLLFARFAYLRFGVHYRLTNHRFFHQKGLLSRTTDRIEVIDMDDITFRQGVIERMVGVGSIMITSSDRSSPQLWLHGIENVQQVADLLDRARRVERRRRGIHIEQI